MHDPASRGQPLNVAFAITGRRAKRVGVVHITLTNDGHRFETTMGMLGEPRNRNPVIHAPALLI